MRRGLDNPTLGGARPLQGLKHALVPVVNRRLVDPGLPDRVAGHIVDTSEDVARKLVIEGEDALRREAPAVLMHSGERGDHLVHHGDLRMGGGNPVGLVRACASRCRGSGHRVNQLPQERWAVRRIARQELVKQGGPRAAEAGHDDGGANCFLFDSGLFVPKVDQSQPVLEDHLNLGPGSQSTGEMQLRFVI